MHFLRRRILWLAVPIMLIAATLWAALPSSSSGPLYTRKGRFGIAFVSAVPQGQGYVAQSLSEYKVAALQAGWYSDWLYSSVPAQPQDGRLEYVQLINVGARTWPPDWLAVQDAVNRNRGSVWIIGNEPECRNQGNLTPAEYAGIYHEASTRIRGWDPTARIAIGGIVEPTPLRFRWLEQTMSEYQRLYTETMKVDVWNIHVHILSEGAPGDPKAGASIPAGITAAAGEAREYSYPDCASMPIFQTMVTDFRTWMKAHGQQNRELIISEMGVLEPSIYLVDGGSEEERKERGDRRIEQFMAETFDWLLAIKDPATGCPDDENRLVQRWLWFSLNGSFWNQDTNRRGFNGSLYDYTTKRPNRFGLKWIYYQNPYRLNVPLIRR